MTLQLPHCTVLIEDAASMAANAQDQFRIIRRLGFGASDSSVILGVNPFSTIEALIAQKRSIEITADEERVGNMVSVRKGADLEPLIMQKFIDRYGIDVVKPSAMYQITDTPLNVNFDGIMAVPGNILIPVECKLMSIYGGKYYDLTKAIPKEQLTYNAHAVYFGGEIEEHIQLQAQRCGIPTYYYTQVQQQMMALDAPFGYLTMLSDKDWELYTFIIPQDKYTQTELKSRAVKYWAEIKNV